MSAAKDLTGLKFGDFRVLSLSEGIGEHRAWLGVFECCGAVDTHRTDHLTRGEVRCFRCGAGLQLTLFQEANDNSLGDFEYWAAVEYQELTGTTAQESRAWARHHVGVHGETRLRWLLTAVREEHRDAAARMSCRDRLLRRRSPVRVDAALGLPRELCDLALCRPA